MMNLRRRMNLVEESKGGEEMDNWETIIDWTAESDVQNKFFSVDDNGQPFKLKKVSALWQLAAPEDENVTSSIGFYVFMGESINDNNISVGSSPKYGETGAIGYAEFIRSAYGLYPYIKLRSTNNTNVWDNFYENGGQPGFFKYKDGDIVLSPDYCTSIGFGSWYNNHAIPAGSRIRIKGVRA